MTVYLLDSENMPCYNFYDKFIAHFAASRAYGPGS